MCTVTRVQALVALKELNLNDVTVQVETKVPTCFPRDHASCTHLGYIFCAGRRRARLAAAGSPSYGLVNLQWGFLEVSQKWGYISVNAEVRCVAGVDGADASWGHRV